MLLPYWGNVESMTKMTADGKKSIVTELDRKIETYLQRGLHTIDPGAGFAGEEFGGSRETERFWLCDPIDGTMQFVRGMPGCTVMLALIENGMVTYSILYDFVNDVMYHAQRGKGAFADNEPIHVSDRPLPDAYISFETHVTTKETLALRERLQAVTKLFNANISGNEFILVATGKLEGRIVAHGASKDWDNAPGTLLVEEAGGVATTIGASTYDFRRPDFIALNRPVYDALTRGENAIFPVHS